MRAILCGILMMSLVAAAAAEEVVEQVDQQPDPATTRVLLLPFEPVGPAVEAHWVARAIQRELTAELVAAEAFHPVSLPPEQLDRFDLADQRSILDAAREAEARFAVFGSYQVIDQEVRITGQVLDVEREQYAGSLRATGRLRDLFAIQDVLAEQLRQHVGAPAVTRVEPVDPIDPPRRPVAEREPRLPVTEPRPYERSELERALRDPVAHQHHHHHYGPPPYQPYYPYQPFWGPRIIIGVPVVPREPIRTIDPIIRPDPTFEGAHGRGNVAGGRRMVIEPPRRPAPSPEQ